jgi:hypothetical protein
MVDVDSGDTLADAKVDGAVDEVFELQDGIVAAFARTLDLPQATASNRIGVRETSSLDAYRAFTEGLVKIESMDTDLVRGSIADFEHAIAFDPTYAMAYTGLANAQFVAYEMTRTTELPDTDALASGIERGGHCSSTSAAQAHAALSFLLMSAGAFTTPESRRSGRWRSGWQLAASIPYFTRSGADAGCGPRPGSALHPFAYASRGGDGARGARAAGHGGADLLTVLEPAARDRELAVPGRRVSLAARGARGGRWPGRGRAGRVRPRGRPSRPTRLYGPEFAGQALVGRGHALLGWASAGALEA